MSHSSKKARVLAAAKAETDEEASSPPVNKRAGAVRGKKKGLRATRVKQTQKARLAALKIELEELRSWKAQMV